jgi:hypothetical protein
MFWDYIFLSRLIFMLFNRITCSIYLFIRLLLYNLSRLLNDRYMSLRNFLNNLNSSLNHFLRSDDDLKIRWLLLLDLGYVLDFSTGPPDKLWNDQFLFDIKLFVFYHS